MIPHMLFEKLSSFFWKLHPRSESCLGIHFHPHRQTDLCRIMNQTGSDKGGWHNYTTLYFPLFRARREERLRVFELGLGTNHTEISSNMGANGTPGASVRGWKKFFPDASVFGADIDARILFQEERIKTFQCDQTAPESIRAMWAKPELVENFDIIIEDGLHEFHANKTFFENSIHKVKRDGYFIIEDLDERALGDYEKLLGLWQQSHPQFQIAMLKIPSLIGVSNMLIVAHKLRD